MDTLAILIDVTLLYSTPLIFAALGGVLSENSGVVNIGLEGMMTIGAFSGAATALSTGNPWLGLLAAGVAGGILALLHAIASITFKADQTVSGIAINFLGSGFAIFMTRLMFNGSTNTDNLKAENKIPMLFQQASEKGFLKDIPLLKSLLNQYATTFIAIFSVILIWYILYKTKLGLRIRAVGQHPKAADTLGISVYKIRYLAVILSGVFAGFGGAAKSLAISSFFGPTTIAGQGFIAIAALIFGKWKPQGALWACLLFGFSTGLEVVLGGSGSKVQIPSQFLAMLPYVITLVVLMIFVGKSAAPKAIGVPYEKGER